MAKYISIDALLAETENLLDKGKYHEEYDCAYRDGNNSALYALKGKLDTLKVKETNLEKHLKEDIEDVFFDLNGVAIKIKGATYLTVEDIKDIAKHFFELGLHYSITKECVNEICQLFMEREAIEKFFPDSIDWVYKQLQKGE